MAAAAVDVGYLAASFAIPEPSLHSLLETPTVELVQELLKQIEARAHEYDELKSEKLRSDVELENAVHGGEIRARALKATADKALKEVEELRQKLTQEENARGQVESELQALKSSTFNSSSEVQVLQSRIHTLESQNRDTVALHESKCAAYDRLSEDLSAQHQKFVNLRKEMAELEEKNQALENTITTVKFRETTMQQEIRRLKQDNDWYEAEMKTRADEQADFRKKKNARVAELERALAEANSTSDALRRTETSHRQRIGELEQKVEESLAKIQHLQDAATTNQEAARAELDNVRRLARLHEEKAATASHRVQELEQKHAELEERAAEEIGQAQAEIDSEHQQRQSLEVKVAELESHVEHLEAQATELRNTHVPATPRRGLNGTFGTPGRAGSPSVGSPARGKGGLTQTQLYSENTELRARNRSLQEQLDLNQATLQEMIDTLEHIQPELQELKEEKDRLMSENGEMSSLLEEAVQDRESARKETRKYQGDYKGLLRESEIQRVQLRDLSAQIRMLLVQQQIQEHGLESLDEAAKDYLNRIARNELPLDQLDDANDSGRLISQQLVVFRNVTELQEQNRKILYAVRELGNKYEGSEAQAKANQIDRDQQELEQLRAKLSQYEDEIKSLKLRSESFVKERDMYRRIATSRGQVPAGADAAALFGQSIDGRVAATPPPGNSLNSVEQSPNSKANSEYAKLVKELQAHADMLKAEYAQDRASYRRQVDDLTREKNELHGEKLRLQNANELSHERYGLQQSKLDLLQRENDELLKRSHSLQDLSAKQDIQAQQVAEQLVEANSTKESLQRENANLKASQMLSKDIEKRLTEDNDKLLLERNTLNGELNRLRSEEAESRLRYEETRRRLENKATSLESELQSAQRKLEEATEQQRKDALRREYELSEARKKIDDLTKALSNIRPELASVKTERDQLQARVDELKVEVHIAQDRAQHLTSKPRANGTTDGEHNDMSREEELSIELSDLRRELEVAREELESAKVDTERYREIAQGAEESLEAEREAHEQLVEEMERVATEKDAKIKDLEQRVEEISSELATTNTELSDLRGRQEEENSRVLSEKELLQSEINRLRDEADREHEKASLLQEDLKAQADIANRAQQNYEHELQQHSHALDDLRTIREEHNQLKTEVAQIRAQGDAARTSLAQNEEMMTETRERYENELAEVRKRYDDVVEQNKILHRQLENVNSQVAGLKQNRLMTAEGESGTPSPDTDTDGLRDVIQYLRREKEIVDVQYELSIQEAKRLKQQLDYTTTQLDQARQQVSAEQLSQSSSRQNAASLESLQNTVEQLNLYRESATTLRNEARQAQARLAEKTKEVEELYNQIQPLKSRVQEVEGELAIKSGEAELLQRDRDHWQKRHQDVLQKYDRIDPAELEALKTQISTLTTERDEAQTKLNDFDERLEQEKAAAVAEIKKETDTRRENLISQFKERSKRLSSQIKEQDATNQSIAKERDELRQQLEAAQQQLETKTQELESAKQELVVVRGELSVSNAARDEALAKANVNQNSDTVMTEEGQINETGSGLEDEERQALIARAEAAESKFNQEANERSSIFVAKQMVESRVKALETQIGELQQRIGTLHSELEKAQEQAKQAEAQATAQQSQQGEQAQQPLEPTTETQGSEEIEKLKGELAASQKENEDLRTRIEMADSAREGPVESTIDADAEARLKEQYEKRAKTLAEKYNNKIKEFKQKNEEEVKKVQAESETNIQRLTSEHEANIQRLSNEHASELQNARQPDATTSTSIDPPSTAEDASTSGPAQVHTDASIKTENQSFDQLTEKDVQVILSTNEFARTVFRKNVNKQVDKAKAEAQEERDKVVAQRVEEAIAETKTSLLAEQEPLVVKRVEDAKAKSKDEAEKRSAVRLSMAENRLATANAKLGVVEQAAKETPERPVKEVWDIAQQAKAPPKPKPAPAAQPTQSTTTAQTPSVAPAQPVQPAAAHPEPRPNPPVATANPFANGAAPGQPQQGTQPNVFGQANPPQPFGQPRFGQLAGPGAVSGIAQPVFGGPQPQVQQQPPPQAGRGRGDGVGTGPAALRNLVGQQAGQSAIPRGGGIPRPSGRGQPNQQNQQGQAQNQGGNVQGAGASQIGRGGGGRRGGRGGGGGGGGGGGANIQTNVPGGQAQQGQNSPRSLNPSAHQFQPGGGRGQKRVREDGGDADGAPQGGKRARGGAGGGH